MVEILNNSR